MGLQILLHGINHMLKHAIATAALALFALSSGQVMAATATGNFQVRIKIVDACSVVAGSASDIDLGEHAASDTNISGSSAISVTCSKGTPYYIGLAPSNGSTDGAGVMATATAATHNDEVPYQLHSASAAGPIWGNTATSTDAGNGVGGTGNGSAQSIPVYAVAASANYTPDLYADTVTVTVNY